MAIKYLKTSGAAIKGKTVFLRLDFNEPVEKGKLGDDYRLRSILPTIHFLLEKKCRIVIGSHCGRPDGKADKRYTLEPAAKHLAQLLERKFVVADKRMPKNPVVGHIIFAKGDITEYATREMVKTADPRDIVVLENLRFYPGEESNGVLFARQLAELADVYVNDAFAVSHRSAASIVAITKRLPSYCGLLLQKEIQSLDRAMDKPKSPFVLMMGGIKISDKAKTLEHLGRRADRILLGGGLANMLLQMQGMEIGKSIVENDSASQRIAKNLLRNFKNKLVLPKDVVVAKSLTNKASIRATPSYQIKKDEIALDVGPEGILQFAEILKTAKTIIWNGPLGHFEVKPFHTATMALARVVGGVSQRKCFSVVGGGETVDAVRKAHQANYIDHVSTGGGAMLEYLSGKELPGIKALK